MRRFLILGILLPLVGCGGNLDNVTHIACTAAATEVTRIQVYPDNLNVLSGVRSVQMVAQALNGCGNQVSGVRLNWKVSDPNVAVVNAQGLLRAVGNGGKVRVTAQVPNGSVFGGSAATGLFDDALVRYVSVSSGNASRVALSLQVFPPQPVVAVGHTVQLSAVAFNSVESNPNKQAIPDASFRWRSNHPSIARVDSSGKVTTSNPGIANIVVQVAGRSNVAEKVIQVVVRATNGAGPQQPEVRLAPSNTIMVVGERRDLGAVLVDPETGAALPATYRWIVATPGVVSLTPGFEGNTAHVTGIGTGETQVSVEATGNNNTHYLSSPVIVRVLGFDPQVSSDWTPVADLPLPLSGHAMASTGKALYVTGGVGSMTFQGGFRELVARAKLSLDGTLKRADESTGWDASQSGDISTILDPCNTAPPCMEIFRDDTPAGSPLPDRWVRYQVYGHGMVATADHLYVIGGIDGQVDLGRGDRNNVTLTGPTRTLYSRRVLIGNLDAQGDLQGWHEGPQLTVPGADPTDRYVHGVFAPGVVRYRDWIYVLGGWGWERRNNGEYRGVNRDQIYRSHIAANGELSAWQLIGSLLEPVNKHAATVVQDRLVIAGGAVGADVNVPESVTDKVWSRALNPLTGNFDGNRWLPGKPLPRPLQFLGMENVPGDKRVVVMGGSDLSGSYREAFVATLEPSGVMSQWQVLPVLPVSFLGVTAMATAGVDQLGGQPLTRIYLSGGGGVIPGSDFELDRLGSVYYIDLR